MSPLPTDSKGSGVMALLFELRKVTQSHCNMTVCCFSLYTYPQRVQILRKNVFINCDIFSFSGICLKKNKIANSIFILLVAFSTTCFFNVCF